MKIKLWMTTFTLPAAEKEKLRKWKLWPNTKPANAKIRYKKHRCVVELEADSVEAAVEWAKSQSVRNLDLSYKDNPIYDEYTVVFGVAEARNGQKCEKLEGEWVSSEQNLFSEAEMEACGR